MRFREKVCLQNLPHTLETDLYNMYEIMSEILTHENSFSPV